jgi:ADP-heptose:LPS heptosyltransferase
MAKRPEDESRYSLVSIREQSLVERLTQATRRIAELEKIERSLSLERDKLAAFTKIELERAVLDRDDASIWGAAGLEDMVRSLTIVQRRDAWLSALSKVGVGGTAAGLFPHDGKVGDPITILVRGSGGFGDMLYLSAVVRLLFLHFDRARVVVLHEHPDATQVFESNPYVLATLSLQGDANREILCTAAALDIFDLIADVRYVVSYATPPLSRVPFEFLTVAHSRSSPWQRFVRREWPYLNNVLAREASVRGMSKYELLGYTANLPVSSSDAGDFFPTTSLPAALSTLKHQRYVTLHHGADRFMSNLDGLSTKNLPSSTWADVVSRCKAAGIKVVQVGEAREPLISGITLDLRGKTNFSETATVVKHASAHLDTEGGLVHLARAMGTASVVAFGPTPPSFFGYEGNINLKPTECGDCWWVSTDWARRCPWGMAKPACMGSHIASSIAQAAITTANQGKVVSVQESWIDPASIYSELCSAPSGDPSNARPEGQIGLVMIDSRDVLASQLRDLAQQELRFQLAVPVHMFADVANETTFVELLPFAAGHIPARTDRYDWALVSLKDTGGDSRIQALHDVIRILKPGAVACVLSATKDLASETLDLRQQFQRLPGMKFTLQDSPSVARPERCSALLPCLLLSIDASDGDTDLDLENLPAHLSGEHNGIV